MPGEAFWGVVAAFLENFGIAEGFEFNLAEAVRCTHALELEFSPWEERESLLTDIEYAGVVGLTMLALIPYTRAYLTIEAWESPHLVPIAPYLNSVVFGSLFLAFPVVFNGAAAAVWGFLSIFFMMCLAAYELRDHIREVEDSGKGRPTEGAELEAAVLNRSVIYERGHLTGDFAYLNCDADPSRLRRGSLADYLNLGRLFPLVMLSKVVEQCVKQATAGLASAANRGAAFYQRLWYDRKYRKARRALRRSLEKPIKLRRYWYLTCKVGARAALEWGQPKPKYPNTPWGTLRYVSSRLFDFFVSRAWVAAAKGRAVPVVRAVARAWDNRPSIIQSFIDVFQPEAPMLTWRGGSFVPLRKPQPGVVNLVSDVEVFASRGGSLLVFIFLVGSFFARIILVLCLIGVL